MPLQDLPADMTVWGQAAVVHMQHGIILHQGRASRPSACLQALPAVLR